MHLIESAMRASLPNEKVHSIQNGVAFDFSYATKAFMCWIFDFIKPWKQFEYAFLFLWHLTRWWWSRRCSWFAFFHIGFGRSWWRSHERCKIRWHSFVSIQMGRFKASTMVWYGLFPFAFTILMLITCRWYIHFLAWKTPPPTLNIDI